MSVRPHVRLTWGPAGLNVAVPRGLRSRSLAEPINLNRARKARTRAADKVQAAENRVRFGRTGAEKAAARTEAERSTRALNGAKREEP